MGRQLFIYNKLNGNLPHLQTANSSRHGLFTVLCRISWDSSIFSFDFVNSNILTKPKQKPCTHYGPNMYCYWFRATLNEADMQQKLNPKMKGYIPLLLPSNTTLLLNQEQESWLARNPFPESCTANFRRVLALNLSNTVQFFLLYHVSLSYWPIVVDTVYHKMYQTLLCSQKYPSILRDGIKREKLKISAVFITFRKCASAPQRMFNRNWNGIFSFDFVWLSANIFFTNASSICMHAQKQYKDINRN